jgi:hypothetical protein
VNSVLVAVHSSYKPIPVAARSKAWVCGRWIVGIAGSFAAESMDVCLLRVLCVVTYRSAHRANQSSKSPTECDNEVSIMRRPWPSWHYGTVGGWGGAYSF